jgi:chitodextrinase
MPGFVLGGSQEPMDNQGLPSESSGKSSRGSRSLSFTENSTGLPSSGDYNFIAFGDFNNDNDIDIAFGGEDYGSANTVGLKAYTGNGGTSWSSASSGLWTTNSWGGLALEDADSDGYVELYATDERWGSRSSSGLKVWEYRSSSWTDSSSHVSTPLSSGLPDNVVVTNITGDSELDIVVSNSSSNGLAYYENSGGNPATWQRKSNGLATSGEFTAIAVADINKDGLKDIVALDYSGGEHMYIQRTSGSLWSEYSTGLTVSGTQLGVAVADVNKDSHMDIIYGGHGNGIKCKLGNSGGVSGTSFTWTNANTGLTTGGRYAQIQVVDIDLDGDLDIIAPEAASSSIGIQIYIGNGSTYPGMNIGWTLASSTNLTTSGIWYGSNCYDINKDGSLDIVAASWGNGVKCYLNTLKGNLDLTAPGAVNDLVATNSTTTTITVNWSAPADNGTITVSGPVQSYDLRYSTANINLGNWASATQCTGLPTPASPGTKQNYTITNLAPGTQYYIALRSQDELPNLSPLSNILINSTLGIIDTIRPGQIKDLQAMEPTNNSINLTWSAPADNGSDAGSGAVIEYEIKYHSTEITNLTWDPATIFPQSIIPKSPGAQEKITISGLQAETTYYFAVKARDERPNWGWISNSDFNTTLLNPDISPPDNVIDLLAIKPTDTTINLTWTAKGDDGALGTANLYDIRYSSVSITELTWATATECINEPTPNSSGYTEHYQVTGLIPNTKYYFALKVADETPRWSLLSNIASNTTLPSLDELIPGKITDLTASQPTSTSVVLSWSAPGDDDNFGTVSGYNIRYNPEPITESLWDISTQCPDYPTPESPGTQQYYTVNGLLSSKKYYFAVKAFDERPNFAPLSNIANETTLSSSDTILPSGIDDLAATSVSANSIKLTWTSPGDDGNTGTATGYDIRYSISDITDTNWVNATQCTNEPTPIPASAPEAFTVTGLFAGTKYYFAIKSFDERPNYSPLSNIASATTYSSDDITPPAKIDNLKVAETTETTATLTWTAVGDDGNTGTATAYEIRYEMAEVNSANWDFAIKLSGIPQPKPAGENETFLVTGLDQETTYYFAIKAGDEVPNWSPVSNSASGTTKGTGIPRLTATLELGATIIDSGSNTGLKITVKSESTLEPIQQANVELSSDDPGLIITPSTSLTGPNGELTVIITAPEVSSTTNITIYADISKTGFISLQREVTVTVRHEEMQFDFNLRITQDKITISKSQIVEDDEITITANITNLGPALANEFTVRFYLNDVQIGNDKQFTDLSVNKFVLVEITWKAVKGEHKIKVEITPSSPELEIDDTDNSAEKSYVVSEKDSDVDGDADGDKKGISQPILWLIILIIIIVVILILVFLLMRKKRKSEPIVPEPERLGPEVEPEFSPAQQEAIEGEEFTANEAPEQPVEDHEVSWETHEGTITETEDTGVIPLPAGDQEFAPTTEEQIAPSEETMQSVESEVLPELEPAPEELLAEGTEAMPPEEQEPGTDQEMVQEQEQSLQQVACPNCQEMIPLNTTTCPHCQSELSWE